MSEKIKENEKIKEDKMTREDVIDDIKKEITPELEKKFEDTIQKAIQELQKSIITAPQEKKNDLKEEVEFWKKALHDQSEFTTKAAGDIDTTANAATIVPSAIYNKIHEKLYQANYVRQFATIFPTGGEIKGTLPVENAGFTAARVAETTAPTDSTLSYSAITWSLYDLKASTTIGNRLFEVSPVAILDYVYNNLANKFAAKELTEFITGTGTNEWTGLDNASMSNAVTAASGNTTLATLDWDDWMDTFMALPQQYRGAGIWITSTAALTALRKLKDNQNLPIFLPTDNTIFGRPVYENSNVTTSGTAEPVAYFIYPKDYFIFDSGAMNIGVTKDGKTLVSTASTYIIANLLNDAKLVKGDGAASLTLSAT